MDDNISKQANIDCPSATIMLDIAKDEYDKERERSTNLDTKANIFISAIIAIIALYIPIIPFQSFRYAFTKADQTSTILITIGIYTLCLALIFLSIAFYNLYKVLSVKPFHRVSYENFNDEEVLHMQPNDVEQALLDQYNRILENNANINNDKVKRLKQGIKYSIISFSMITLSAIFLLIVIG